MSQNSLILMRMRRNGSHGVMLLQRTSDIHTLHSYFKTGVVVEWQIKLRLLLFLYNNLIYVLKCLQNKSLRTLGFLTHQNSPSWSKVKPRVSLSSSGTACHSTDLQQVQKAKASHNLVYMTYITRRNRPGKWYDQKRQYVWQYIIMSTFCTLKSQQNRPTRRLGDCKTHGVFIISVGSI